MIAIAASNGVYCLMTHAGVYKKTDDPLHPLRQPGVVSSFKRPRASPVIDAPRHWREHHWLVAQQIPADFALECRFYIKNYKDIGDKRHGGAFCVAYQRLIPWRRINSRSAHLRAPCASPLSTVFLASISGSPSRNPAAISAAPSCPAAPAR